MKVIRNLAFLAMLALPGSLERSWRAAEGNSEIQKGERVYLKHCVSCHPLPNEFDLASTSKIKPRPRNFAKEGFRYGSSAKAVQRNIATGIVGTPMPAFKTKLSRAELRAVTKYLLMLRSRYALHLRGSPVLKAEVKN